MIKFVACDLDGTLLPDDKTFPVALFPLIEEMASCGILFAPASGRQYGNLETLFFPVKDKICFICENGALVRFGGRELRLDPVEEKEAARALDLLDTLPELDAVLCCKEHAFYASEREPFRSLALASYTRSERTDDLRSVLGREPVMKIAVFSKSGDGEKRLAPLLPSLRVVPSGYGWCDVSSPTADKGRGAEAVQRALGIGREECLAFGDERNDLELLRACGAAFVPENAAPALKALFPTIPSNNEGGVLQALKKLLRGELL